MAERDNLYLVVTSDGDGRELADLTCAIHGRPVPKALAMITADGSLLFQTFASIRPALPFRRAFAIVRASDEAPARSQLALWPDVKIHGTPEGRGLACDLLQVVAEILMESPNAEIVVASAECYFANRDPLVEALARARGQLGLASAVLLGTVASDPESCCRRLLPGARLADEIYALADIRHAACGAEYEMTRQSGTMWYTSTFVARGSLLASILARALPVHAEALARLWRVGSPSASQVARAFDDIPDGVCHVEVEDLLVQEIGVLAVARMQGCGWNAWHSPDQVFSSLQRPFELAWLLSRFPPDTRDQWSSRVDQEPVREGQAEGPRRLRDDDQSGRESGTRFTGDKAVTDS